MIETIKNNNSKVTLQDIANEAGVGVATVDRVINGRAKVSEKTMKKVLQASQALGYHGHNLIKQRVGQDLEELTLGFILQRRESYFYRELAAEIERGCEAIKHKKVSAKIEFLDDLTPRSLAQTIEKLGAQVNALGIVAADHAKVNIAVESLQATDKPVFTLLSDITASSRAGYVGIDNRAAGRTAAWAITKLAKQQGKIGIIMGSHRYLCQELCEISFRSYCRENAPQFQIVESVVSLENKSLAEDATLELLKQNPDLVGLYCAGGGVEGVLDALKGMPLAKDMIVVANELTHATKVALMDGILNMVISHPRDRLVKALVEQMIADTPNLSGRPQAVLLPFDIHISENI